MKTFTHDWHVQRGALFEEYFGYEVPSHYGNYEQEYHHLRNGAGIRDAGHFGKIRITGRDRHRFLNGMLTNDIKNLEPGSGVPALFLDVKGHIQADMKVYAFEDHFLIVLQHCLVQKLMTGLDRYLMSEDVRMQDAGAEFGLFQVLGPQVESFLAGKGIQQLPRDLYAHNTILIAGREASLIRLPSGCAMLCSLESVISILDVLDGPMIGAKAFEVFRIESGLPLMRRDMDETNFPQECRLETTLNFHKGCYLGQETIARIDSQGHVNRHLTGIESDELLPPGEKLFKDGKETGRITSSTTSLLLKRPFALGYVRREHCREGESLRAGANNTICIVRNLPLTNQPAPVRS